MSHECCTACCGHTGKVGACEDSIYYLDGEVGPLCDECHARLQKEVLDDIGEDWRLFVVAPKDGSIIQAWREGRGVFTVWWCERPGRAYWRAGGDWLPGPLPTLWKPMAAEPDAAARELAGMLDRSEPKGTT